MNALEFKESAIATFKKYFPNGYVSCTKYQLGGGIGMSFGLISNLDDTTNKIRENDNLRISMGIHENFSFDSTEEIQGKIVLEFNSSSLSGLPENQYFAMSNIKIPSRKINNTPEKVLQALDKYFVKARDIVRAERDANNIYAQERIPAKYLEI